MIINKQNLNNKQCLKFFLLYTFSGAFTVDIPVSKCSFNVTPCNKKNVTKRSPVSS